jgi:hypothetical protein
MSIRNRNFTIVAAGLLYGSMGASASCSRKLASDASQTQTTPNALKAIYLVGDKGELGPADLKAHPEITVVHTWADFQAKAAQQKIALWIDKGALSLVKTDAGFAWLHQEPQKWYPIVVVGYNDALYSFREALPYFGISGPMVDWSHQKVEPGFSLWKMQEETPSSRRATLQGFKVKPTVKNIQRLTTRWLSAHKSP